MSMLIVILFILFAILLVYGSEIGGVSATVAITLGVGLLIHYSNVHKESIVDLNEVDPKLLTTDSLSEYEKGYRRGQIDCQNDSIVWRRTTTDDGEIIFQKH